MSEKSNAILKRQIEVRAKLWPDVTPSMIWSRDRAGFVTMPRPMPLILRIMDMMAGKGVPVSQVYFDLWCRTFDEGFIQVTRIEEMAGYSGFTGQRAVRTWKDRLIILRDLGFIKTEKGLVSEFQYVLLLNPYHVIAKAYAAGRVSVHMWTSLVVRCAEVGASDLDALDEAGNLIPPPVPIAPTEPLKSLIGLAAANPIPVTPPPAPPVAPPPAPPVAPPPAPPVAPPPAPPVTPPPVAQPALSIAKNEG